MVWQATMDKQQAEEHVAILKQRIYTNYELMTIQIATAEEHVRWWISTIAQVFGHYSQYHCSTSAEYYSTCSIDDEAQAVFLRRHSDGGGRDWNRQSNSLTTVKVVSLAYLLRPWLRGNSWRSSNASSPVSLTTVSPWRIHERSTSLPPLNNSCGIFTVSHHHLEHWLVLSPIIEWPGVLVVLPPVILRNRSITCWRCKPTKRPTVASIPDGVIRVKCSPWWIHYWRRRRRKESIYTTG